MIEVLPSPGPLVSIRVSGKVDKAEWEQVTATVREALSKHDRIAVYAELSELDALTAGAAFEDAKFALKNFGSRDRFTRVAVTVEEGWISTLTEWSEKLVPDLETQVFHPGQEEEALQWVSAASA